MQETRLISYTASPTLIKFHKSNAFFRGVRGPIGSGKSVGMCLEIMRRLQQQEPGLDGTRKSRWAIIRNTYPELETTTVKTWLDWFPEEIFGKFSKKLPMCHYFSYNDIVAEIYFLALDRPEDIKKLLSLELTGIWYNEARELPIEVITTGLDRVGRYPSQRDRPPHLTKEQWPTWYGGIADTNSPEEDHWWPIMAGEAEMPDDWTIPDNWEFFTQPAAAFEERDGTGRPMWRLNPDAENLENLPGDYYKNLISGKSNSHVRVYVANKYGIVNEGKIVYPEFSEDLHVAKAPIPAIPNRTIYVGLDFGQTPAASFSQRTIEGQWRDIHELVTQGVGATKFANMLKREIAAMWPSTPFSLFEFWGDPSGDYLQSGSDQTYFEILRAQGINVKPSPSQNPVTRVEAGRKPLEEIVTGGHIGYQLSPTCKVLRKGYKSGYRYKKIGSTGSVRYDDKPEKNRYSHIHEARQYALVGAGYARELQGKNRGSGTTFKAKASFNPLG
jgi:hypothetical protein